LQRADAS